ncbi:MAG: hypothetical protein FJ398_04525 [Verrucomicrobia bacterium]|nr:hypothetical protein [Verrucomicrobiota bacterium]
MSAVSETIVREYFELHGFLVRQQRKFIPRTGREDAEIDFLVFNPQPKLSDLPLPPVLSSDDLRQVARAIVVVKGWHTETFSSAMLSRQPEIFRFVDPKVFQRAARAFGAEGALAKILVVPSLPQHEEGRSQTLDLLKSKGIDAVIPFGTLLADLIDSVETNRNYQKSDLLQILRILKNYEFFKERQMELFKPKRPRSKKTPPAESGSQAQQS